VNVAPHLFWITSRAAGGAALLLASASVAVGLLLSGRRPGVDKRDLRPIHEALSLSALAMVGLHGLSLLGDSFLHPGLAGIAIPFAGGYRPLWTGIGIIAGYGLAALGLSYYLRNRIGAARWRRVHRFTALFWVAAIVHTIGAGSDASQLWFLTLSGIVVLPAAALLALRWLASSGGLETPPRRGTPQLPRELASSHRPRGQ
jgi:sulfoxide reductase heme-binding subunit YedZ